MVTKNTMLEFTVDFSTKFGNATDKRKAKIELSSEDTFRNCLKKLPKWIEKTWEVITFEYLLKIY